MGLFARACDFGNGELGASVSRPSREGDQNRDRRDGVSRRRAFRSVLDEIVGRHDVGDRVVVGDATHGDDGVARVGGDGETKERGVAGREFYEERRLGVRLERFRGEIILGDDRRVVDKMRRRRRRRRRHHERRDVGAERVPETSRRVRPASTRGDEGFFSQEPRSRGLAQRLPVRERATQTRVQRSLEIDHDRRRERDAAADVEGCARRRSADGVLGVHQTMDVIVRHARLGQFILFDETHE